MLGFRFSQSLSRLVAMTQDGGIAYSDDFGASDSVSSFQYITVTAIIYSEYDSGRFDIGKVIPQRRRGKLDGGDNSAKRAGQGYIATDEAGVWWPWAVRRRPDLSSSKWWRHIG